MDFKQTAHTDDIGVTRGRGQVPQQLGFLDKLFQPQRVHFLSTGIDRDNSIVILTLTDGTGKIFLDRHKFVKINSARLIDDTEPAHAKHFFKAPFA